MKSIFKMPILVIIKYVQTSIIFYVVLVYNKNLLLIERPKTFTVFKLRFLSLVIIK